MHRLAGETLNYISYQDEAIANMNFFLFFSILLALLYFSVNPSSNNKDHVDGQSTKCILEKSMCSFWDLFYILDFVQILTV